MPISTDKQGLCYFHCIISFGIQVIISYLAMIYSYIPLILFIKPNIINSKFNKFFIHFSPYFLYIGIIFYILRVPELFIFLKLIVYPKEDLSRLLNYFLVFIFLLINIISNIILIHKIKNFIGKLRDIDSFAKEKLDLFRKNIFI